jgi:hypothetical protein
MSNWNLGQPIFISAAGIAGASTGPALSPEWRRWIVGNVLLRRDLNLLVEVLLKNGFDRETILREIQAVQTHPYIEAARAALPALAGDVSPGGADSKIKKRDWVLENYRRLARQASSFGQVPRVRRPSRLEFLDRYYARNEPVVIEGAIADWPALKRWTPAYFKERFGDRLVEVQADRNADPDYEINAARHKKEMRFGEFVDLVESAGSTNDFYLTASNDARNKVSLAELWQDVVQVPEYLRDDPERRGFFWYGPQGTVTPLHHDLTNNLLAQVRGRKLVRLIAPYELADVYNHRHCFSQVDLDRVDLNRYPKFLNVKVMSVVLSPGELLFLPVGWWHHVRGLDVTAAITFTNFAFDNNFHDGYTTFGDI